MPQSTLFLFNWGFGYEVRDGRQNRERNAVCTGRDREPRPTFLSEPFLRAKRYCISCGRLAPCVSNSKRCSTCVRKARARTTKKITVFGVQRPQKPQPIEPVVPVKVVPLPSPRGLLEAPKAPPERERKYPRIDLSYLRRDRC